MTKASLALHSLMEGSTVSALVHDFPRVAVSSEALVACESDHMLYMRMDLLLSVSPAGRTRLVCGLEAVKTSCRIWRL